MKKTSVIIAVIVLIILAWIYIADKTKKVEVTTPPRFTTSTNQNQATPVKDYPCVEPQCKG